MTIWIDFAGLLSSKRDKKLCYCRGTARRSVEFLQLQNISFEN